MNQFVKTAITFGLLVVLLFGLYFFASWFSVTTGYVLGEDEKIKLAQCLDGKDSKFYRSTTCPLCDKQVELFGKTAMNFIEIVDCKNFDECPDGGVPSWEIQGKIIYGFKNFNELSEISGCVIDVE
jgi:hypothetical protein